MKRLLIGLVLGLMALTSSAAVDKFYWSWVFSGTGVNDNDILFTTEDVQQFDRCTLISTAGAVDVFLSPTIDGNDFSTAAYSLQDLGATTNDPVLVTSASRYYGFVFKARRIKVLQNGGTAATAYMSCWTPGQDALYGR